MFAAVAAVMTVASATPGFCYSWLLLLLLLLLRVAAATVCHYCSVCGGAMCSHVIADVMNTPRPLHSIPSLRPSSVHPAPGEGYVD